MTYFFYVSIFWTTVKKYNNESLYEFEKDSDFFFLSVAGLSTGQIKVFHPTNGSLLATLDNEDINEDAFPISRVKCKPYTDGQPNSMLAATYVTGHLRVWNFGNGQCMSQVRDEDPESEYLCLSHNPFVDVIAVGMANGHIKLFDEKTMQVRCLIYRYCVFNYFLNRWLLCFIKV